MTHMSGREVAQHSMRRMWGERNCDRVHVFANGYTLDKAHRRAAVRANIRAQRAEKAWEARWAA